MSGVLKSPSLSFLTLLLNSEIIQQTLANHHYSEGLHYITRDAPTCIKKYLTSNYMLKSTGIYYLKYLSKTQ